MIDIQDKMADIQSDLIMISMNKASFEKKINLIGRVEYKLREVKNELRRLEEKSKRFEEIDDECKVL